MSIPKPPLGANPIACAVCLNIDNRTRNPATTIVNGFAVCDSHAEHLTGEYTDFAALMRRIKTTTTPGEPL